MPVRRPSLVWGIVICVLGIALTVSLATRMVQVSVQHASGVQAGETQASRQHMDRDAYRWVPPAPVYTVFEAASFYPRVSPAGPPLKGQLFDESLYNRPPPSC